MELRGRPELLSRRIVDESMGDVRLPQFAKRRLIRARQVGIELEGVTYRHLPASRYRVWCLERLPAHLDALDATSRAAACALLDRHGGRAILENAEPGLSGHSSGDDAPTRGIRPFDS